MKKIYSLLLFTTLFCSTALPVEIPATKKKPIIITDFDDVWIKKSFLLGSLAYLKPLEALLKAKSDKNDLPDKSNNKKEPKLHGLTLKFLDYGRRHPILASSIPGGIEYLGKSRCINQPIHNLYRQLKENEYTLMIATNKDRPLYDFAIDALGNEIPAMVSKTFVSEPKNNQGAIAQLQTFADQPTTPEFYKNMVHKTINLQETGNIFHVPSKKPAIEYFKYVVEKAGTDNDMIFVDDNEDNVNAFNELQKDSPHLRLGILYDENNLDQFTQDITKAGIVSETKNKALLDDIRYPGISGKIKLFIKKLSANT